jgi:transposase-like protein
VDDQVNAMGGDGISTSQVSRVCQELAVTVKAFLDQGKRLRLTRLSVG